MSGMKLSKTQRAILEDMKNGAILVTSEGANYKAWLEYSNGAKKSVRTDTATLLHRQGYLQDAEGAKRFCYYYTYSGKRY